MVAGNDEPRAGQVRGLGFQAPVACAAAGSAAPYPKRASGRCGLPQVAANPSRRAAWPTRAPWYLSCKTRPAVLLAPGILSPCRDHSQDRSLRSRPLVALRASLECDLARQDPRAYQEGGSSDEALACYAKCGTMPVYGLSCWLVSREMV
jgi:hypothetical protein